MTSSRTILVVNRNPRNAALLRDFLVQRGYGATTVGSPEEIDQAIDGDADYCLALIDISGFDVRIWERCSRLHQDGIPFLVISSTSTQVGEEEVLRHGARGVLSKPLAMKELANLIDSLTA